MKNQLLIVAAAVAGIAVGRLSNSEFGLVSSVQAAALPQSKPPKPPRFPGGKGHTDQASKKKAREEVEFYRKTHSISTDTPKAYLITRQVIDGILKQKGCQGLRIYPAYNNTAAPYEPSLVIVGVEKAGAVPYQDQVGTYKELNSLAVKEYVVGQTDDRCPSNCEGTAY